MADIVLIAPPERDELMRCLRTRLEDLGLSLRVIAEGMLGADSPIDFVTVDPSGRVQLVLVSTRGEDLALVGHALAQRAWVTPRLRDWLKLSPELGIRPERGVGVVLLAPSFGSGVIAAAQALEPESAALATYRCVRNGGAVEVLLDTPAFAPAPRPKSPPPRAVSHDPTRFRTGLTDDDLGVSPEEERDLS